MLEAAVSSIAASPLLASPLAVRDHSFATIYEGSEGSVASESARSPHAPLDAADAALELEALEVATRRIEQATVVARQQIAASRAEIARHSRSSPSDSARNSSCSERRSR